MRVRATVGAVGNQEIGPGGDVSRTAASQVVDTADAPAAIGETVGQMAAEKAGDPRDKDLLRHRLSLVPRPLVVVRLTTSRRCRRATHWRQRPGEARAPDPCALSHNGCG